MADDNSGSLDKWKRNMISAFKTPNNNNNKGEKKVLNHPNISNAGRIFTSLASGAMAGAVAKSTIAPLDRTKIYFQTHPDKNYRIKGAVKFLRLVYTNDGFLSLWRGNSATMARIVPYAAIQFMAHEQYKRLLGINGAANYDKRPGVKNFIAGSLAGLTGQSLTYPLDRARAVMAVTKIGEYRNLADVFRRIGRDEGLTGLYRGFTPTVIGVFIYAGTSFFTYESLKFVWSEKNRRRGVEPGGGDPSPAAWQRLLSGATAGLIGQASSYPLDIVRRRMQTARQMGFAPDKYATILGTLRLIYRKEGVFRGWYKGISMNFIKGPIAAGISFTTFDYFQLAFRKVLIVLNED